MFSPASQLELYIAEVARGQCSLSLQLYFFLSWLRKNRLGRSSRQVGILSLFEIIKIRINQVITSTCACMYAFSTSGSSNIDEGRLLAYLAGKQVKPIRPISLIPYSFKLAMGRQIVRRQLVGNSTQLDSFSNSLSHSTKHRFSLRLTFLRLTKSCGQSGW